MTGLVIATASVYVVLAVCHAYWAAGCTWPAHDEEALARAVVGGTGIRMPSPFACLVITGLLAIAGGFVLATRGFGPIAASSELRVLVVGIASVMLLRGLGGLFENRLRPAIRGTRYARYNRVFYSPFALAVGIATLACGVWA